MQVSLCVTAGMNEAWRELHNFSFLLLYFLQQYFIAWDKEPDQLVQNTVTVTGAEKAKKIYKAIKFRRKVVTNCFALKATTSVQTFVIIFWVHSIPPAGYQHNCILVCAVYAV